MRDEESVTTAGWPMILFECAFRRMQSEFKEEISMDGCDNVKSCMVLSTTLGEDFIGRRHFPP